MRRASRSPAAAAELGAQGLALDVIDDTSVAVDGDGLRGDLATHVRCSTRTCSARGVCPGDAAAAARERASSDRDDLQRRRFAADEQFGLTLRGGAAATYGISKAALNALTATLAAELADTPILVNAVCPGLTASWPGAEQMGARPAAGGAASVVWAATLPEDGLRGGFFRDGEPLSW